MQPRDHDLHSKRSESYGAGTSKSNWCFSDVSMKMSSSRKGLA
jgi:hypothetical protein